MPDIVISLQTRDFVVAGAGTLGADPSFSNLTATSQASGFIEWRAVVPRAGMYHLHALLTSPEKRPCALRINGAKQSAPILDEATGGNEATKLRWFAYGPYDFKEGANRIRIEFSTGHPLMRELLLTESKVGLAPVAIPSSEISGASNLILDDPATSHLTKASQSTGFGQWTVRLPSGGRWYLHVLMTFTSKVPCVPTINDVKQPGAILAEVTGSQTSEKLTWFTYGPYDMKQGDNVIRLDFTGWMPHLREIAFSPEAPPAAQSWIGQRDWIGNPIQDMSNVDGSLDLYFVDQQMPIAIDGNVVAFRVFVKQTAPLQLVIYRRSGPSSSSFAIVGRSQVMNIPATGPHEFVLPLGIAVKAGDLVGFRQMQRGSVAFSYSGGAPGDTSQRVAWSSDGLTFTTSQMRVYAIQVQVEALVDRWPVGMGYYDYWQRWRQSLPQPAPDAAPFRRGYV